METKLYYQDQSVLPSTLLLLTYFHIYFLSFFLTALLEGIPTCKCTLNCVEFWQIPAAVHHHLSWRLSSWPWTICEKTSIPALLLPCPAPHPSSCACAVEMVQPELSDIQSDFSALNFTDRLITSPQLIIETTCSASPATTMMRRVVRHARKELPNLESAIAKLLSLSLSKASTIVTPGDRYCRYKSLFLQLPAPADSE